MLKIRSSVYWFFARLLIYISGSLAAVIISTAPAFAATDSDPYNYYPLIFKPDNRVANEGLKDVLIWNMVVDQGYEVSCGENDWKISAQLYGDIKRYFELFPNQSVRVGAAADQYIGDLNNARIGMLRGNEEDKLTLKNSSLEGFFSAFNIYTPGADGSPSLNSTGVANRLLPAEGQCFAKYSNLSMMDKVCETLSDVSSCSFNFPISGVEPEVKALDYFRQLTTYFSNTGYGCKELMDGAELDSRGQKLREIMNKLPLSLSQAYRLAFLVIAPVQNTNDGGKDPFFFLQSPEIINETPKQPPIFLAFRIPEFLTNKPQSLPGLFDGGKLTEAVLRDKESLDELEKSYLEKRANLAAQIVDTRKEERVIKCEGFKQCENTNDERNALRLALIDIINGFNRRCGDDVIVSREKAGEISTPATAEGETTDPTHLFKPQFITPLLAAEDKHPFTWSLLVESPNPPEEAETMVAAYVVAPLGTNIDALNNALTAFFGQETFKAMEESNVLPDYNNYVGVAPRNFTIKGAEIKLKSSSPGIKFTDPADPKCKEEEVPCDPLKPNGPKCTKRVCTNNKSWSAALTENKHIGLIGAKVGWMVRKIQENLRENNSRAFKYIKSCERVEDLFLGKCAGVDSGNDDQNNGTNPVDTANGVRSEDIDCVMKLPYDPAIANSMKLDVFMSEMGAVYKNSILIKNGTGTPPYNRELVQHIISRSQTAGWNPALVLALGREETAWGAVGNRHILGCMVGNLDGKSDEQVVDQQLDCLFGNFEPEMSCQQFMCKYSGDSMTAPCVIKLNPFFAKNLPKFYRLVTGQ